MSRLVRAENINVGDEVMFLGVGHVIRDITPYVGDLPRDREGWRLATDAAGWAIALIPGQRWEVA